MTTAPVTFLDRIMQGDLSLTRAEVARGIRSQKEISPVAKGIALIVLNKMTDDQFLEIVGSAREFVTHSATLSREELKKVLSEKGIPEFGVKIILDYAEAAK